jgi:hypothetical protein
MVNRVTIHKGESLVCIQPISLIIMGNDVKYCVGVGDYFYIFNIMINLT